MNIRGFWREFISVLGESAEAQLYGSVLRSVRGPREERFPIYTAEDLDWGARHLIQNDFLPLLRCVIANTDQTVEQIAIACGMSVWTARSKLANLCRGGLLFDRRALVGDGHCRGPFRLSVLGALVWKRMQALDPSPPKVVT